MTRFAAMFSRVPRPLLFALAALIQIGLIAAMVADRARILRDGTDVTLQTRPVDPRDFLRGDYVALGYDFSSLPSAPLKEQTTKLRNGAHLFVQAHPQPRRHLQMVSTHAEPISVTAPDVLIRGRIQRGVYCGPIIAFRAITCRSATASSVISSPRAKAWRSSACATSARCRSSPR